MAMVSQLSAIQRSELEELIQDHQCWISPRSSPPTVEHLLTDGLSNTSLLLRSGNTRWVARFGRQPCPLGTNFEREIHIHSAAHNAGVAPRIAFSKLETQLLVTDYVDRADELPADTRALAGLLRRIHGIELPSSELSTSEPLADALNVAERIEDFVDLLSADHWLTRLLAEHTVSVDALCKAGVSMTGSIQTVCHNDLLLANRRWDTRLLAIDWEYACKGDPLFDLAVCLSELNPAARKATLSAYFGREPHASEEEKIAIYEQLYQVLAALWTAVYSPQAIKSPSESLLTALRSGERYK